jgi:hypothetical protein
LSPRTPDSVTVLEHLTRLEEAGIPVDWVRYHAPFRATGRAVGDRPAPSELPFRIERVVIHESASAVRSGVAVVRHRAGGTEREVVDVSVVDACGRPVVEVFGLELGLEAAEEADGSDRFSPEEAERLLASLDALTEDQVHALLPLWAGPDASTPVGSTEE